MRPTLVIMAAGMGSRYGGLKQMDPVDDYGNTLLDFSIYDARRAGFTSVVFIIKENFAKEFKAQIGQRIEKIMDVSYVYQELDRLPDGFKVPSGRKKPWGTAHAIMCCEGVIKGPFAVINADDFYGQEAFKEISEFLSNNDESDEIAHYAMVGYLLKNTVTDNGYVSRGVCQVNEEQQLISVTEYMQIEKHNGRIFYTLDQGKCYQGLEEDTIVSMNLWGFGYGILKETKEQFQNFLKTKVKEEPLKSEFFLPSVVSHMIEEDKADVKVLKSHDTWYGITYKEDKQQVVMAIKGMREKGIYPQDLMEAIQ